jgi:hypothetical protein
MLINIITLVLTLKKLSKNSTNWKRIDLTLLPKEECYNKEISTIKLKKNIMGY